MKKEPLKIISKSHHRNGISGDPFDIYLFTEGESRKVALDFGGMSIGVLDVDRLNKGDIAFGSNSWRGDHYLSLREMEAPLEASPKSLFLVYSTKTM